MTFKRFACIGTPATLPRRGIVWQSAGDWASVPTCAFEEYPMPAIVDRGIGGVRR